VIVVAGSRAAAMRVIESRHCWRVEGMKSFLLATLLLLPLNAYAQVKQESWQRVLLMDDKFENYKNDFIQFGQARSNSPEASTDVALVVVADQTVTHLRCVETLVAIYLKVSTKQDRLTIWPLITDRVAEINKRLGQQVEVTNTQITQLHTPVVVAEAMRMRDDLRQLTADLDGAMKEIETQEAKVQ
jgi:hypothetical protein